MIAINNTEITNVMNHKAEPINKVYSIDKYGNEKLIWNRYPIITLDIANYAYDTRGSFEYINISYVDSDNTSRTLKIHANDNDVINSGETYTESLDVKKGSSLTIDVLFWGGYYTQGSMYKAGTACQINYSYSAVNTDMNTHILFQQTINNISNNQHVNISLTEQQI